MTNPVGLIRLVFLLPCFAAAQSNVEQLIKEQQNNDSAVRQQNQVKKKDIYSSHETRETDNLTLPDERPCFRIDKMIVKHSFLKQSVTDKIKEDSVGRCLGKQGITLLAQKLQDRFINAGYVTTRVEIPLQDLSSNVLILNVIPGRIDELTIVNDHVSRVILPFKQGDILNVRDVEQGLENLQRVPGMDVKINIEPAKCEGYSKIIVYPNRKKKGNIRVSANNWGDKNTGGYVMGASGYAYNLAHLNDIFYLSGSRSVSGGYSSISSDYSFPLGYWEYEVFYSHSYSRQRIDLDDLNNYSGESHYVSIKSARMLYRDRDKKFAAFIEALRRKSDYQLGDIELALQKRDMSNVRLGINYKQNYAAAMLDSTLAYQRFTRWGGGHLAPDMAAGEVSSTSQRLNLDVNYIRRLSDSSLSAYYDLKLAIQYAPAALVLQDQLSLGSRWDVRGFENSTGLYGDKGFYLQNTVSFPTKFTGGEYYSGLDYGEISTSSSSQQQGATKRLMDATAGVKGSINSLGYDLSFSVPLRYPAELKTNRMTLSFNLFYLI